ncbi:unnamed protein product [Sphenostylis stenocarpa]|uniref:Pentatricopeptide repeat-containing protein n=1 Tax=Sphenostylis stenocarpa TaxID=92480 RepID=A0AA86VTE2_9FABA|nr:unnamed protein product [Sphenostylis stenocarpa]
MLADLTRSDHHTQSLTLFALAHSSFTPDHYTLSTALTAAANGRHVAFGTQLHAHAVRTGLRAHSHVANSLLSLYAKACDLASVERAFAEIRLPDVYSWTTLLSACAKLAPVTHALQLFDQIPKRHVAVWNALITGCADKSHEGLAFNLFRDMQRMSVKADKYTFATMLSLCSLELLDYGRHVHSVVIKSGILGWTSVVNSLITMYFKCGSVVDACEVFEEAEEAGTCDYVTYNAMIDGFVSGERNEDAFFMFRDMQKGCFGPTEVTFVSVMSSCSCLRAGCQAQAQAIKMGLVGCVDVNNAMMTMYSGFGEVYEVRDIFERMEERDVVSWNIMVSTFLQENLEEEAILSYLKMRREGIEPDEFTYGSLLVATDSLQLVEMIHSLLCKSGLVKIEVLNALVSAYCRHRKIKCAFQIFSAVTYKNLVSWNSIISGFLMNGHPLQGLDQFSTLLRAQIKPNAHSLSLVLSICSSMSAMSHGKQVHGYILRHGFYSQVSLGNALVTMYAKCGSLDGALRVFNAMVERDTISWNAIISAYAQHGRGEDALSCFEEMQITPGIKPDQATFTSVLSACSHAGLVDDGACIFDTMVKVYGIFPSVDHFSCVVDLLGRSGYLDEAERVIKDGYLGAHSNMCWSMFSACAAHGNLKLGRTIAGLLLERENNNPSVYVLLSNIYAAAGQWEEAANLRNTMRELRTTKQPGCKYDVMQDIPKWNSYSCRKLAISIPGHLLRSLKQTIRDPTQKYDLIDLYKEYKDSRTAKNITVHFFVQILNMTHQIKDILDETIAAGGGRRNKGTMTLLIRVRGTSRRSEKLGDLWILLSWSATRKGELQQHFSQMQMQIGETSLMNAGLLVKLGLLQDVARARIKNAEEIIAFLKQYMCTMMDPMVVLEDQLGSCTKNKKPGHLHYQDHMDNQSLDDEA